MTRQHTELATAFHEAGHGAVLAFRTAPWLPKPAPLMPVRLVEISDDGHGNCVATDMGLEGLVSKHRDSTYRAGRFDRWVKVKNRQHPAFSRVIDSFS